MKRLAALAVAAVCALAAIPASASAACPPGHSTMGCSLPTPVKGISTPPRGEIVPDVSSYQGTVNWAAVKAWQLSHGWKIPGGIFKLGEYVLDRYAVQNGTSLRVQHMAAVGYVFIRPGVLASTVIAWARAAGVKVVVLDEEVPGISGTAARITPALKAAGLIAVDYHSLGNVYDWTAQGLPCWVADYGPRTPPVCTTGKTIAWQFSDIGSIPGISGLVDESISYGLLKLTIPPKPPRLICFPVPNRPTDCQRIITLHSWLVVRRNHWNTAYEHAGCTRDRTEVGCSYDLHWYLIRRAQAVKLHARYAA